MDYQNNEQIIALDKHDKDMLGNKLIANVQNFMNGYVENDLKK